MTPATEIAFEGENKPIAEWAMDYGITPSIIIARLQRGEAVADAIAAPMKIGHPGQQLPIFHPDQVGCNPVVRSPRRKSRKPKQFYTFKDESHTLKEWAVRMRLSYSVISYRIRQGWTIDAALGTPLHARPVEATQSKSPVTDRGVVSDFRPIEGTGAGRHLQETSEITFSEKAITE